MRVSIVCFGDAEGAKRMDGVPATTINADLSALDIDITRARRLTENENRCFQGPVKVGAFDVEGKIARCWLAEPTNTNGMKNTEVLRPWVNGSDLVRRPSGKWIIDFADMSAQDAEFFELPFEHVIKNIRGLSR